MLERVGSGFNGQEAHSFAPPRFCTTCEITAPGMTVAMTRTTGSEAVLSTFEAPEHDGPASRKIELNTCKVWSMVVIVHVVVPAGVDESCVAKAKICRASSSGKFAREIAAHWYTMLPLRWRIDAPMAVARFTMYVADGVQKNPNSRASACILSSWICCEVTLGLIVVTAGITARVGSEFRRRDVLRGCTVSWSVRRR